MAIDHLKKLFSVDYPTVKNYLNAKIIGPVKLPIKINKNKKSSLQCYLYSGEKEKYLICLFGEINHSENVYIRVSSACVFGFILNSLLCDCKNQFDEAVEKMISVGGGILIFGLDQHGKGIGIDAHFLVYAEGQRRKKGLFSEIYKELGLNYDYRDYHEVIDILQYFKKEKKFHKMTMLTESPDKREYFSEQCLKLGLEIEFDNFNTQVTAENVAELSEKVAIGYQINNFLLGEASCAAEAR